MSNYTKILGYDIYNDSMESFIDDEIKWDDKKIILSGNPEILNHGLANKELHENFTNSNTVIIPDGISLIAISRFKRLKMKEKIAGIETLNKVFSSASENAKRVYILGAEKEVLENAILNIKTEFPNINIVGYHHGYFDNEERIVENIKKSSPELLVVALRAPKQEEFLYKYMDDIGFNIGMGVGGSLDIIGGKLKRAPRWMINIGMEWAYRVIKEPVRIKRLGVIPKFILKGIREKRNDRD